MARCLPEHAVHYVGRADLVGSRPGILPRAHVVDERAEEGPSLRVPERRARRLFLEVEELHLAPEAPMVALLGFLEPVQISLELLLVRPGGAVDALEHLVPRIAPPVGAGDLEELEGADLAGGRQVGATAEVDEVRPAGRA